MTSQPTRPVGLVTEVAHRRELVHTHRVRIVAGAASRRGPPRTCHAARMGKSALVWSPRVGRAPVTVRSRRRLGCGPAGTLHGGLSCLNVTCVQCENGKSISTIDSAQATLAHDADTDSDFARPSDGKHPSAQHDTPAMLLRSASRRRTTGHVVELSDRLLWMQDRQILRMI